MVSMTLKTLQNLEKELNYLLKDGTLEEVLTFLGIRYFEGSLNYGNENRIVYEFEKDGLIAISISTLDGSVKLWGKVHNSITSGLYRSFWVWLAQNYSLLFERLIYLLNDEYNSLGDLDYTIDIQGKCFDIELTSNNLDSLDTVKLALLSNSDLENLDL
jgi:hypothetical protein